MGAQHEAVTLADRLGDLARALEREDDLQATLDGIVHAVAGTVPGAEHASLSAIHRRQQVETRAATGDLPRQVDQAQYDTGTGPCLDSLYEQRTVRLDDTASEQRWPEFTQRARELGVGSMLAVQLYVEGTDLGALNLFNSRPDAFDVEAEHVALLFAAHSAVALSGAQQRQQMQTALRTRDLIGQAKGVLMERFGITADQAFALLVKASQHSNRKLVDVAEEVAVPGQPPSAAAG